MADDALHWRKKVVEALQSKTHPQQRLLSSFDIKSIAQDRGFWLSEDALELWDRLGIFHPVLRVKYPYSRHYAKNGTGWPDWEPEAIEDDTDDGDNIITVIHEWPHGFHEEKTGVHPAIIDTPTIENFVQWQEYQQDDGKPWPVKTGGVYYHPYQIFRLSRVIQGCQSTMHYLDFATSNKIMEHIRNDLKLSRKGLENSETYELKVLFLLLCIEDRYLPELRGGPHQIQLTSFGSKTKPNEWYELEKNFDAQDVLTKLSFSIEEIKSMREHLARVGWNLDPNQSWFELVHHIPHERRQRLRGDALFAWDYYNAAEMIGDFLHDATGEPEPHVDDLLHGGHWKKKIYGFAAEDINYKTGNALNNILARFTINPRMKVLLMLEGDSEVEYIRVWCREHGLDLENFGVNIYNMNGIPKERNPHIRQVMQNAHEADAAVVVVLDNENEAPKILQKWLEKGLIRRIFTVADLDGRNHPIGGMVWESSYGQPCFEEANFSPEELILALGDYLESHPQFEPLVDRVKLKSDVEGEYQNLEQNSLWFEALTRTLWKMHISQLNLSKPEFAACLARRFANTDRPIHRLIHHVQSCAVKSAAYGRADPDGGYGRPFDE